MSPAEFKDDLERTGDILEGATGRRVVGYRVAHEAIGPRICGLWKHWLSRVMSTIPA